MHTLNPNHTTHNTYPQTTTLNKPLLPTPTHTNKTLLPTPHITSKHKTPLIAHPPYTITLLPTPLLFTHITHTERKKLLPTQCTSIYSTTQHHNAHPTNPNITYHQSNTTNPNPNTRLYTSPNPDFAQAVKATFKFVQLHHHYKNWKHKTPNKIEQNIQHLFTNITPPNPNNEFNITMKAMQEFVSCDIRQLVREHIEDEIKQTITDLEHLNPHDKSLIIHTASRQLHNTLKNKIQPQEIRQLLAEAFYMLGLRYNSKRIHITSTDLTHNTPQTHTTTTHTDMEIENNSPTQQTPTNNHQSDTSATSTHTEKSNNTHTTNTDTTDAVNTARKRKLTDRSPPTPLHNDSPLTPQNNSPITINSTPDTSDTDTQTSPIQHINFSDTSAELNLTSSTDSYTDQAGILHKQITTNKENWKIHDTPPHITTLIIGDSNLRQWTDIPYNWMVECLPGAKIVHIHNILQKHTLSTSLTRLVISIGINNRTETTLNNDKYLRQLHNLTKTLSIDTHFLAPSFTHALPADQQVNLRKLNDTASKLFKNNYVAPLCHQQTTILKSDKHKIHHTKDTSDLLIRMVQDHLNYLDHIKRRKT